MKYSFLLILLIVSGYVSNAQGTDPLSELTYLSGFTAKFSLDENPNVAVDTDRIAIWKMKEDVDNHNYFVVERSTFFEYAFTYMNREGSNRTYENVRAFSSKIGNTEFLNVGVYDRTTQSKGYFFLKVTSVDKGGWNLEFSLVDDATLKDISSREALRERITRNLNNPKYFKAPVHFHKVLPLLFCK